MILSFHPLIEKDENRICAGRLPNKGDLKAIRAADAVILPQGCYQALYEMARENCAHIFPNYDTRFKYPGKSGQAGLFREAGVLHPKTACYFSVADFSDRKGGERLSYPVVFKFDWGGEGESVHLIHTPNNLEQLLNKAKTFEQTGQTGFVLQTFVATGGRSLRVVIIGKTLLSYWRISGATDAFLSGVSSGARIVTDLRADQQAAGKRAVADFCRRTRINLAGFDILFFDESVSGLSEPPLFLEINYFFGRRGLGGSEKFYGLLQDAVEEWIQSLGVA